MEAAGSMGVSPGIDSSRTPGPSDSRELTTSTSRAAYLPQLDGLRAVAVLMVFVHHAYAVPLLWSGVDLFFILSGYLITNILLRDSGRMNFGSMLGRFYLRRAQRILPPYILCLVLITLLTGQKWAGIWPFYAFFLQNVPYAFHWIGFGALVPLWSLAVEQHFYLVWPFLVYFLPKRALGPCMVALLLGVPVLRAVCTHLFAFPEAMYVLTPFRIDTMAAGALAALWLPHCRRETVLRWAPFVMLLGVIVFAMLSLSPAFRRSSNSPFFNSIGYSLNIVIFGGLFLWSVLADVRGLLVRFLSSAPLRALGRISYTFYLLHLLMLTRFGFYFSPHLAAPIVFLLTVVLATLSWYALEKPVLALGGRPKPAAVKL